MQRKIEKPIYVVSSSQAFLQKQKTQFLNLVISETLS